MEEEFADIILVCFLAGKRLGIDIEEELNKRNINEFVISTRNEKRLRVFGNWALKKGCTVRKLPDWDGVPTKVYRKK